VIALDDVLARLDGVRSTGRGFVARCPAHPDQHPSLSVRPRDDGQGVLLHCFARQCPYRDIMRALHLEPGRNDASREQGPLPVHTLALRIARSQPWCDPLIQAMATAARRVRSSYAACDELRRRATMLGDTERAWDALALAAELEHKAATAEHALDEALA
jgi:hypothetical protein